MRQSKIVSDQIARSNANPVDMAQPCAPWIAREGIDVGGGRHQWLGWYPWRHFRPAQFGQPAAVVMIVLNNGQRVIVRQRAAI